MASNTLFSETAQINPISFPHNGDGEKCGLVDGFDFRKGVKSLVDSEPLLSKLPSDYILPVDPNLNAVSDGLDLPIIDLSGLDGSPEHRASTIEAIGHACAHWGFFRVKNHGVHENLMADMLRVVEEFFGLDLEEKMKFYSEDVMSPIRYGTSLNTSRKHNLHWRDFLRHYGPPFQSGKVDIELWPSNPPDYRNVASAYVEEQWKLAMKVGGAVSESLGLDSGYFERSLGEGVQILACNYYPPCPEPDKTLGLAAHSDNGGLIILMENGVDGLQIKHDDAWFSVSCVPSTFLVNVGDYLEVLSNGRYKSIEHRAVVNRHKTRISVALGHGPDMSRIMEPAGPLALVENSQYRPIVFKDYVKHQQSITSRGKTALDVLKI